MTKIKEKRYCYTCGSKLTATILSVRYDNYSGEPIVDASWNCVNNKEKGWLSKHKIWEPVQDY